MASRKAKFFLTAIMPHCLIKYMFDILTSLTSAILTPSRPLRTGFSTQFSAQILN